LDIDEIQARAAREYKEILRENRLRWATTFIGLAHTTIEIDAWSCRWRENVELVAYGEGGQSGEGS
jgi:hypothetical protein